MFQLVIEAPELTLITRFGERNHLLVRVLHVLYAVPDLGCFGVQDIDCK